MALIRPRVLCRNQQHFSLLRTGLQILRVSLGGLTAVGRAVTTTTTTTGCRTCLLHRASAPRTPPSHRILPFVAHTQSSTFPCLEIPPYQIRTHHTQRGTLFSASCATFTRTTGFPVSPCKGRSLRNGNFDGGGAWRVAPPAACMSMTSQPQSPEQGGAPELDPRDMEMRKHVRNIFLTAVEAVMPRSLLQKAIHFDPDTNRLTVENRSYSVHRNVFVVGFGKAVLGMGRVVEEVLGEHIIRGLLSIPLGARDDYVRAGKQDMLLKEGSRIQVAEGAAQNLPDTSALRAARDIHSLVSNLTATDIVIVLMSGGGSALLPYPRDPLTLEDIAVTTRALFSHGASITDVNSIRQNLEVLKGGGLARAAMPAQVISLIISDVIGNPLEVIASGPTVPQTPSPQRCLEVIDGLHARDAMPPKVLELLEKGKAVEESAGHPATSSFLPDGMTGGVTGGSPRDDWGRVHNVLVGSNAVGCGAAIHCAQQLGFFTCDLSHSLAGQASTVGQLLARVARYVWVCGQDRGQAGDRSLVSLEMDLAAQGISKDTLNELASKAREAHNSLRPLCVVAGGETVVNVTGGGKGGRNQELALAAGLQLQQVFQVFRDRKVPAQVFLLSAGTDGQDGPTEAAGALVDENFAVDAASQGLNPETFLAHNDSFSLWSQFARGRDHVVTGLTGTNVMDIHVLLVMTA
ncbi:glycerate kinase-like isoform X2 [Babylonia areolata]|uniref:glycerate kinase-like isoform X2 n=1 Tax=Babylonia areolata TaxID=304850 RepID=UPI003FD48CEC